MSTTIQSVGAPPERHADRVVAEIMRQLAERRARLWPTIEEALLNSSDGSPKAQRKMAERLRRAGATSVKLTPGKRGRYTLHIYDRTGWDPTRDEEITVGDPIPEKPWIACHLTIIESRGQGRGGDITSSPVLFITHHALSRTAQRFGLRTEQHLEAAAQIIWNGAITLMKQKTLEHWLDAPPEGHRAPLETGDDASDCATVVLKRHENHKALIAATVF